MPIYIYILVAIGLYSAGLASGWRVESWHMASLQQQAIDAAIAKYKEEAQQAADASAQLEKQKEQSDVQFKIITKTVDRIVEKPVYRNICLDADGLRAVNSALTGAPSSISGPHPEVRTFDGAGKRVSSGGP